MSTTSSASVSAASINASDVLAVAALLSHAVETPGLISACMAYQDGVETLLYKDGDVAAGQGHLSLLRLRRALCRKGKGSEGGANGSNNEAGGDDGCSTDASTSTTCRIDAGRNIISTGRRGTCRGSSSVEEEEGGEDEDWNEGGADKEEEVLQLEDLTFSHRAADWAAAQGHLGIVRWLLENRDEGCTESAVDGACWNGHEATVRWLMCEWGQAGSERALDYAASTGRLELVKWLSRQRGSTCTVAAMDGAAGGGHLAVVCWMAANRREGCSQAAFEMAAAGGHLDVIKWLEGAGFLRCSSVGLDNAAEGNHLSVLQWMLEQKPKQQCSSNAYGLAASRGHLEVLKWLHVSMPNLRCPSWAAETAAAAGHFEVVRWLHASGLCPASFANLDEVAGQGQLHALCWLSERGASASLAAVDRAAETGHPAVVEYLLTNRQEGCSPQAIVGAARHGHLNVVKLLRELRPEQCECVLTARAVAAAAGHVEVVRWLDEVDPDLLHALQEAVVSECSINGGGSSSSSDGGDNDDDENSETPWEILPIAPPSENHSFSECGEVRTPEGSIDGSISTSVDAQHHHPGYIFDHHVDGVSVLRGSTAAAAVRIGSTTAKWRPEWSTKNNKGSTAAASEISSPSHFLEQESSSRKEHTVDADFREARDCEEESHDAVVDCRDTASDREAQRGGEGVDGDVVTSKFRSLNVVLAATASPNRRQIEGTRPGDDRLSHEKMTNSPCAYPPATREVSILLLSAGVAAFCVLVTAGWSLWLYTAAVVG